MAAVSIAALVPAAGASTRMQASGSKALMMVGGRSVIERTVSRLRESTAIGRIVVLAPANQIQEFRSAVSAVSQCEVIAGGATRQDSVRNGLEHLGKVGDRSSHVLVHDAARCLLPIEMLSKCVAAAAEHSALTAAIPVSDSLIRVVEGVGTSLSREGLWLVQTPQIFEKTLLVSAHREHRTGATDDASLVESLAPIHIVAGSKANLKLTTPEDVVIAEALLKSGASN